MKDRHQLYVYTLSLNVYLGGSDSFEVARMPWNSYSSHGLTNNNKTKTDMYHSVF